MAIVPKKFWSRINLRPEASDSTTALGDLQARSDLNKITLNNGSSASPVVTASHTETLTNKTINAPDNTLTNISNTNIATNAAIDYSKLNLVNSIVNADINSSAAIADSKLATIATASKVSNSATTATDANTALAIVARDASGNFTAGTITATLNGNITGSAVSLSGINSPDHGGTGVANNAASTLTISGNFATTLTVTASTSVTLPTSGTLATLAGTEQLTNKDIAGGTASNTSRITVPSNTLSNLGSLTRKAGTVAYATDTQTLYIDNGSSLLPVGGNWSVNNSTSLSAAGSITISTTLGQQLWRVASGTGGPITLSSTPFGTSAPGDGTMIRLIGTDLVSTVTISANDASNGCVWPGASGSITLAKYDSATFQYSATDGRYILVGTNF